MSPFVDDLGHKLDPIFVLHRGELELNLDLFPGEKGAVLAILNVVYTLDSFAIEFMSLCVGNPVFNEFKTT